MQSKQSEWRQGNHCPDDVRAFLVVVLVLKDEALVSCEAFLKGQGSLIHVLGFSLSSLKPTH